MNEPGVYYVKWNKLDTERQIQHDLTYTWNLEKSNSQKQRIESCLWGGGEMGGYKPSVIIWISSGALLHSMVITVNNNIEQGFPGGAVVENLPASVGDTGSSPGLGGSHMPRSNWARETQLLSLRIWSLCSATREAVMVRGPRTAMKSGPHLLQLEKALAQKRRPNAAKKK